MFYGGSESFLRVHNGSPCQMHWHDGVLQSFSQGRHVVVVTVEHQVLFSLVGPFIPAWALWAGEPGFAIRWRYDLVNPCLVIREVVTAPIARMVVVMRGFIFFDGASW